MARTRRYTNNCKYILTFRYTKEKQYIKFIEFNIQLLDVRNSVRKSEFLQKNKNLKIQRFQGFSMVAEVGFEPHDLRVMSPTSYQAALPRDINGAGNRARTGTRVNLTGF